MTTTPYPESQRKPGAETPNAAPMILYSGPLSMFGAKAEIAAREKGLDF